ncbi:MAG: ATP-dependent zinc metalloprotease FtsH [Elusimicrobiota bacterium]|nr:ATP-dependent zinc metalloprotease FtsH [Endomicrobiia bacterium]MDW8165700.1 ATP-dependent zinc metalloprotease FtsH [Elusimicrobiota bacterium]
MKKNEIRSLISWVLIFFLIFLFFRGIRDMQAEKEILYSDFKTLLREGKVVEVKLKSDTISGKYKENSKLINFKTYRIPEDSKLVDELEYYNVKFTATADRGSWFWSVLLNFGPVILIFLLWYLWTKQLQSGGKQAMMFGKSRARLYTGKNKSDVTFKDVAGCDEVKEELQEIIDFLKDPKKFQRLGGKIPKGVLLYGPPGTGKTLLAKAVAGEAGVPFFSASGSEFVEMFVGVGASRVRDLFEQGRKYAPCLLFIDELDAVGRHRFAGIGGGHDEREQTLNQLLVELDGFDTTEGVILIGATNRPDVLDPALLRPGRFDRHIVVPVPDIKGREEILRVHTRKVKLADDVNLSIIAQRTPGFVGADLANLVNEAALLAARKNKDAVDMSDFDEAIEKVMAGPARKSRVISEREKKIIAYHEAGHALVAKLTPGCDPVHKISLIPRGPALGYTLQLPAEDKYIISKQELLNKISVLLGGRTAERIVFNDITTGAQNDLSKATEIATKMVTEYGMSEKIGPLTLRKREEEIFLGRDYLTREKMYSEATAKLIDEEIKSIIENCEKRVEGLLSENINKLHALAKRVIEKEVLEAQEIDEIIKTN